MIPAGFVSLKRKETKSELETIQKAYRQCWGEELGIQYDSIQNRYHDAIRTKVFILTGGPGTGKTTVINGIIAVYTLLEKEKRSQEEKQSTYPSYHRSTGRAARRMNELTGLP